MGVAAYPHFHPHALFCYDSGFPWRRGSGSLICRVHALDGISHGSLAQGSQPSFFLLPLFIDGARLGAALNSPVCDYTLADMARMCDVFTIGGTKMGLLFGEAAVFSAPELAKDFRYFIKQNGGMLAKGRLLGVQFYAAFKDGLYDRIGAEEVRLALRLRDGFRARGWSFLVESPSNQQFPILPDALIERLKPEFSCSHTQSFPNGMSAVRFCTSWATTDADIDALLDAIPINA